MNRIITAQLFATRAHEGQTRKGKTMPYITHPLTVGVLLARSGASEEIVIAGILHDTIEDTDVTYEDIEKEFGKEIAEMVNDVTEQDKSLPWAKRKQVALDHIEHMKEGSLLVKTADVLHNLTDQIIDFKELGDTMFSRYNAGKEDQLVRYEKVVAALKKRNIHNPLLSELEETLQVAHELWK